MNHKKFQLVNFTFFKLYFKLIIPEKKGILREVEQEDLPSILSDIFVTLERKLKKINLVDHYVQLDRDNYNESHASCKSYHNKK